MSSVDLVARLVRGLVFESPLVVGTEHVEELTRLLSERAGRACRSTPLAGLAAGAAPADLVVAVDLLDRVTNPPLVLTRLKRLSSRYVVVTAACGAPPVLRFSPHEDSRGAAGAPFQLYDEERLAGLLAGCGLRLRRLEAAARGGPPEAGVQNPQSGSARRGMRRILASIGLSGSIRPDFLGGLAERMD